ncbi:MAG: TolC family protein [Myxococcota bacterium]
MRFRADWLAIPSLLFAFAPVHADDPGPPIEMIAVPFGTVSAPEPEAAAGAGAIDLSLDAAIQLALENNLDVEVQRFGPLISATDETIAWGRYDPELFAEFGYARNKDPNSFALNDVPSSVEDITDGFGGFRGLIPLLGSSYDFRFTGSRRTTNSSIESLSPALRSSFALSLTQPLLRGLWWNEPWTRVKTSHLLYDQSTEEFRRAVMNIVQRVENAYWDLIAKEEQMNVQQKSLETAEALLEQSKVEYEVGVASKVKVIESEAGVAQREFELIRETNLYRTAQDVLADLILGSRFTPDAALTLEPTDRPDDYVRYDVDPETATERAFALRPELSIAQDQIDNQELEVKFAKNQRLPNFDITVTYGNKGLAGEGNANRENFGAAGICVSGPRVGALCVDNVNCGVGGSCMPPPAPTPIPSTDFGQSLDDFLGPDATDQFSARAIFSIPIPNTAPRARVSRSQLLLRQLRTEKRRVEQRIILEIRKAIRDITSAQEGIEAARRQTAASAEQLRAERVRLEYGESTPFDVLLRESELVQSQNREIFAFRRYRSSVTDLNRAQGTILRNRDIAIDAVRSLR